MAIKKFSIYTVFVYFLYLRLIIIIVIIIIIIIIIIILTTIIIIKVLFPLVFSVSSMKKYTVKTIFLISNVYLAS